MYGKEEFILCGVRRHMPTGIQSLGDIRTVARDQKKTGGVVSALGADRIHKKLVHLIGGFIAFVLGEAVSVLHDRISDIIEAVPQLFISALEYKVLIVILEGISNLCPHLGEDRIANLPPGCILLAEDSPPLAVPVIIQHHEEAILDGPVHDLLNPVHIFLTNGIISVLDIHGIGPCHGDPKGVHAGIPDIIDHFLGGNRLSPQGFEMSYSVFHIIARTVHVGSLHGVPQVKAIPHDHRQFLRGHIRQCIVAGRGCIGFRVL